MSSLKFKQLLILSNSEKSGNSFSFKDHLNLIMSTENNVGKSTIVKLLFWTLGCEPDFDTTWYNLDCKTIVCFEVGDVSYQVLRYKKTISIRQVGGEIQSYTKISDEYSERFAEIVGFKVLLPNRNGKVLDVPPPAYYFLPYYIDQKRSWTRPWDSFDKLSQYENWKNTVIKYHVGLLTARHFEIEREKYDKKYARSLAKDEIQKLDTALLIVAKHLPEINSAVTVSDIEFQNITREIREELVVLAKSQEDLFNEFAKCQGELAYLESQKAIAEEIVKELESDYQFSVQNVDGEEVECPICGTFHQNTAVERSSILVDKIQAESQLHDVNNSIQLFQSKLNRVNESILIVRNNIERINSKYILEDKSNTVLKFDTIIESIAGKSLQDKVTESRSIKIEEEFNLKNSIKSLTKEQGELQSKKSNEDIINSFMDIFINYANILQTDQINFSAISSPFEYSKIVKEGGSAENVRVVLAYNMAIYSTANIYSTCLRCAFVLDTPNQHEQSIKNYENIINLIQDNFPKQNQLILCAMDNDLLNPLKENAHVIELTTNKILDSQQYEEVKKVFDEFSLQ